MLADGMLFALRSSVQIAFTTHSTPLLGDVRRLALPLAIGAALGAAVIIASTAFRWGSVPASEASSVRATTPSALHEHRVPATTAIIRQ